MASSSARGLQLAFSPRLTSCSTTTTTASRYVSIAPRSQRIPNLRALSSIRNVSATTQKQQPQATRSYSSLNATPALKGRVVEPLLGTGPPPDAPVPSPEFANGGKESKVQDDSTLRAALLKRRMKVARALQVMRDEKKKATTEVRRFWKGTSVKEVHGAYEILLDSRALRRPDDKQVIRIPLSKGPLANALALEWDQLTSSQDATKNHLLPLTSLVSRAIDIAADDAKTSNLNPDDPNAVGPLRAGIASMLMRYLDTDSLLCWSPPVDPNNPAAPSSAIDDEGKSLRDKQEEAYNKVVPFMMEHVWKNVKAIIPVLDEHSIMPKSQDPATRDAVQKWIEKDLDAWEVAGLERATLAAKSLLIASRLVAEWGEGLSGKVGAKAAIEHAQENGNEPRELFGVEEAAQAASIEVDWQISRWGEVEDTHDVEKADVRRQLGGVVLVVSGTGTSKA
ncbi:protein atp12, mitochondrial [Naviculisporaceae sp. PSN 640]